MAAAALSGAALAAQAWGVQGHRLVGELAQRQLTPAAQAEVERLLALEPGATLGSVASWADDIKDRATRRWHFVHMPADDCVFQRERDCPEGDCAVAAIERQSAVLASAAPAAERLAALKFLVHLVGDVHQPLHTGLASDHLGQATRVLAFGQETRWHALWDSGLIRHRPGGEARLRHDVAARLAEVPGGGDAAAWIEESCREVHREGFDPPPSGFGPADAARVDPLLVTRLAQAAKRLAELLNQRLP